MITEHLEFLLLEEGPKPTPPPSRKPQKKTAEPPPEVEPELSSAEEEVEEAPSARNVMRRDGPPKSINSWGVRDRAGEWITIPGDPDAPPMDYRTVSRTAKNIGKREASLVFENLPDAFQLIDGCDWWACLSDEDEVLVVVKEKTNVPAPKTVRGAGTDSDGPGSDEASPPPSTEDSPGDD